MAVKKSIMESSVEEGVRRKGIMVILLAVCANFDVFIMSRRREERRGDGGEIGS